MSKPEGEQDLSDYQITVKFHPAETIAVKLALHFMGHEHTLGPQSPARAIFRGAEMRLTEAINSIPDDERTGIMDGTFPVPADLLEMVSNYSTCFDAVAVWVTYAAILKSQEALARIAVLAQQQAQADDGSEPSHDDMLRIIMSNDDISVEDV